LIKSQDYRGSTLFLFKCLYLFKISKLGLSTLFLLYFEEEPISCIPSPMKNIAIIGGGACGTAVFIELLLLIVNEKWRNEVKLTLIEKEKHIGYGLAFGTDQPGHLLNTQADLMGIYVNEPGHFSNWIKER